MARVTNGKAFFYPGYNEMITGHPDARIDCKFQNRATGSRDYLR